MSWAALHSLLDHATGAWSACVCDGTGVQRWGYGEHIVRSAASLIKVPLAMAALDTARLEHFVQLRAADCVEGEGPLDRQPGHAQPALHAQVTIERLIAYALIYSDNTAANALIDQVGMDAVNALLHEFGLQTRLRRKFMDYAARAAGRDNITTAADMCALLHKLRQPRYATLLNMLHQAVDRGKLEAGLPPGTKIAHKIGDLPDVEHDAGIVFGPQGAYIVAVLGVDLDDVVQGRRTIAEASRLIWQIMAAGAGGRLSVSAAPDRP